MLYRTTVSSLVAIVLIPENIVDIEDIIAVLIVISIVLDTLARLRQYSSRISGRLVFELRVAYPVSGGEMSRESLKRLLYY